MCKIIAALAGSNWTDNNERRLMNASNRAVGICLRRLKNIISMHSDNRNVFSKSPAITRKNLNLKNKFK